MNAQPSFRRAAQCALCMFMLHSHCPLYAIALFATHRLTRATCTVRWPSLQPLRMQQTQENGLALLYSALTLRTHINSATAQAHGQPSGQHLRCVASASASILTGAAVRLDALSQQTVLGESVFLPHVRFSDSISPGTTAKAHPELSWPSGNQCAPL